VNLLFDENLSHRLAGRLNDLFPGSSHVVFGNLHADDFILRNYARANGFSIVTSDGDFYDLAVAQGLPPKVVWLLGCDSDGNRRKSHSRPGNPSN
jgi:predicted nuclease of predicted toxin-antitoxin system